MKIVVIGVARSRTTVLIEKLRIAYPHLNCLYEYYTHGLKTNNSIINLSQSLVTKNNFIVKILSHNGLSSTNPQDFCLEQYDQLFLIERPDFFNQCCSLEFSGATNIWHRRRLSDSHEKILLQKFLLKKDIILFQAQSVAKYLEIKKYIIDNKLNYFLHDYNDFESVPKTIIAENNLNYSKIFKNYHLKNDVENLFFKYFSYSTCEYNPLAFNEDLNKIF